MKTTKNLLAAMLTLAALLFASCENPLMDKEDKDYGILPENFKVDIPTALSNNLKSATLKSTQADTINGNHIYWYLNAYIAVGEGASDIVEAVIRTIHFYKIENVISLSYTSQEDNRIKNLDVISDLEFEGRHWEYQLTITDAESEGNEDGGIGMQICWNKSPIEGIAIFKPYNLNRVENTIRPLAKGKIEYSEISENGYDAHMIVEMTGLPVLSTFEVSSMKMFVGRKGDVIDVIGNSNHPKARFNPYDSETEGFNWAFVASGSKTANIAVAEVGLPLSSANISDRPSILEDNSIKKVLTREMTNYVVAAYANAGITLRPDEIANYITPYLRNADAPGYFNSNGFVKGGTAPDERYFLLENRVETLIPYNPFEIANLQIDFNY
jgi:hypothetical protein